MHKIGRNFWECFFRFRPLQEAGEQLELDLNYLSISPANKGIFKGSSLCPNLLTWSYYCHIFICYYIKNKKKRTNWTANDKQQT